MAHGFLTHIARFLSHAVRHINEQDILNHPIAPAHDGSSRGRIDVSDNPDDGYVYVAPNGRITPLKDFYKDVTVEQAFNEVLAMCLGEAMNCAIAPVMFNYDPDRKKPVIHSFTAFTQTVTAQIVLQKAKQGDALQPHDDPQTSDWVRRVDAAKRNLPLPDMEQLLFLKTVQPMSRLIPLFNWIGGGDPDASNLLFNQAALIGLLTGVTPDTELNMYFCDFSDSSLIAGFNYGKKPMADTQENREAQTGITSFIDSWPTISQQQKRLAMQDGDDPKKDVYDIDPLINPLFAPHLDFAAMRETMALIASYTDETITGEMQRIAQGMEPMITKAADKTKLFKYADYIAQVLILRRDVMKEHMAPLLAFEGKPKPDGNPFALLSGMVDAELANIAQTQPAAGPEEPQTKSKPRRKKKAEPET